MGEGFYRFSQAVVSPPIRGAFRVTAEGVENVPKTGGVILASNHLSYLDHYVTGAVLDRQVFFISKAQHFDVPVQRWLFKQWGVIPLNRGEGDKEAFTRSLDTLREGRVFCIYPEGTRSMDGKLHKGRTGVARLALASGSPVVPVACVGTDVVLPKGKNWPKWGHPITVRFGAPLTFPAFGPAHADDRKVTRDVTDEIMRAIQKLSGQEYVDEYHDNPDYAKRAAAQAAAAASSAPTSAAAPAGKPRDAKGDGAEKARSAATNAHADVRGPATKAKAKRPKE